MRISGAGSDGQNHMITDDPLQRAARTTRSGLMTLGYRIGHESRGLPSSFPYCEHVSLASSFFFYTPAKLHSSAFLSLVESPATLWHSPMTQSHHLPFRRPLAGGPTLTGAVTLQTGCF